MKNGITFKKGTKYPDELFLDCVSLHKGQHPASIPNKTLKRMTWLSLAATCKEAVNALFVVEKTRDIVRVYGTDGLHLSAMKMRGVWSVIVNSKLFI